jgi:hypothetical protein
VKVNTSLGKMFKRPHQCKYVHSGTHLIWWGTIEELQSNLPGNKPRPYFKII